MYIIDPIRFRLHIVVEGIHYYDIGIRGVQQSSRQCERFGELQPKFLEDFIHYYGKKKIRILSYGKLANDFDKINDLLK